MNEETISGRFRIILKETGLTQQAFAESIGLTRGSVAQWLAEATDPTAANLFAIEEKYGYLARWIQTGHGPRNVLEAREEAAEYVIQRKIAAHELMDISKISEEARRALDQTRNAFEYKGHQPKDRIRVNE